MLDEFRVGVKYAIHYCLIHIMGEIKVEAAVDTYLTKTREHAVTFHRCVVVGQHHF